MTGTSRGQVKGTDGVAQTSLCKVDIERGRKQRFMPHKRLDRQKIRAVFVKMRTKGMAKGMAGEPVRPAKTFLVSPDVLCEKGRGNGKALIALAREKKLSGFAADIPVAGQKIECILGKNGITTLTVLGVCDMDAHLFAVNIFTAQAAEFTDTKPGGIQNGQHGFCFQIGHGGDEMQRFLLRGNVRKICIKLAGRELRLIPGLMEDIEGKEAQLCNCGVDGAVRKIPGFLEPADKIA